MFNLIKFKMKKIYLIVLVLLLGFGENVFSQMEYILKQVVIVNGGAFETEDPVDFVTVASYNPETGATITFDTIYTQSAQCVVIDNGFAYVAAQDSIMLYNLDTRERITETKMSGVNQLKVYNEYLIVGRQYPATNKFVKILNKDDLSEISAFENISGDTYGITVDNDTVFVAVNGGWAGTEGHLAKIYLGNDTPEFVEEFSLGVQAIGISQLYNTNNVIYSVNKTPYGGTVGSFTEYHSLTQQVTSTVFPSLIGNGIGLAGTKLYVQLNGNVGAFEVDSKELSEDIIVDNNESLDIMGVVYDEISEQFYVNFSSYYAAGEGKVFNLNGEEVDTYEVGISAEAIALDYRLVGSIEE
jgi:hypothetical protein